MKLRELTDLSSGGGGLCVWCLEPVEDLASPYLSECENCGHATVVPAVLILAIVDSIEEDEE